MTSKPEESDIYLDAYNSVVRYLQECREEIMEKEITDDLNFRDLDGHSEDQIIENKDYLFIKDFSGEVSRDFHEWLFNVGISTFEDENLFRHHEILNFMLRKLLPETVIPVYNSKKNLPKGFSLITRGSVLVQPMSKYNTRAIQYLLVSVVSTETTHAHQPLDRT